jgi:bacterioferritin-associated ferredoxin
LKTAFIIFTEEVELRMYVCVCRAVTEESVRAAIDAGARTVEAVTTECCAGEDCGACHDQIEDMIEDAIEGRRRLPVVRAA